MRVRNAIPAPFLIVTILVAWWGFGRAFEQDISALAAVPDLTTSGAFRATDEVVVSERERENVAVDLIVLRPLFHKTRRPFVAKQPELIELDQDPVLEVETAKVEDIALPPEPPHVSLVGIFTEGQNVRVLLQDRSTLEEHWASTGAVIEGWTISTVEDDAVSLSNDGETHTLKLFD